LIDRLFLKTPALVYSFQGKPILIDHVGGDCGGTRDVLVSGMYDKYLIAIGPGTIRNVIDIGANGGGFSLCLLMRSCPLESLVCVEMNPNTFARLQYNIVRNKIGAERYCLNAAVSNKIGYLDLRVGHGSAGDSLENALVSSDGELVRVQTTTVEQIIQHYFPGRVVDLCKIDIEGGEYAVFKSAGRSTLANVRYLLVELHNTKDYCPESGVTMLTNLGFREVRLDTKYGDVFLFENIELCSTVSQPVGV